MKILQNENGSTGSPQAGGVWLWILLLVAVAVVVWLVAGQPSDTAGPALSDEDTTGVLEAELEATDLGDVEADLEALEEDLQSL